MKQFFLNKISLPYWVLLICIVGILSCKKNSLTGISGDFLQIKLNGKTYTRSTDSGYVFYNQKGCVANKNYVLEKLGEVSDSTFFFHLFINYYQMNTDFVQSVPGSYSVSAAYINNITPCNLGIEVSCDSVPPTTTSAWTLQSSGSNTYTITNIQSIQQTTQFVQYQIRGNFSIVFTDTTHKQIPVEGSFQKSIVISK